MINLLSKFELPTLNWFVYEGTLVYKDGAQLVIINNGLEKQIVNVEGAFALEYVGPRMIIIRQRNKLVLHKPDSAEAINLPEHDSAQFLAASESHILLRLEKSGTRMLLLYAMDGQPIWQTNDHKSTSALLSGNSVLIRTQTNEIHCLALADGKPRWTTSSLSEQVGFKNLIQLQTDEHRLIAIGDGGVMSINVTTSQPDWVRTFDRNLFFTGTYTNNILAVFSYGTFIQLDVQDGANLRTVNLTESLAKIKFTIPGHTSPAIGNQLVLIASNYEPIAAAISLDKLEIESVLHLGESNVPASITPVISSDRIFIQDSDKILYVFQC